MNISFSSLFACPHYFTLSHLGYLKEVDDQLKPLVEKYSWPVRGVNDSRPCGNYQDRVCRLVHYIALQDLQEQVFASQYSVDSLKAYFDEKIKVQQYLNRCRLFPDRFGRLSAIENLCFKVSPHTDKAANVLYQDQKLANKIIDYVNRQEAEFFTILPRRDQLKVLHAATRGQIWAFIRSPEGVLTIILSTFLAVVCKITVSLFQIRSSNR